MRTITGLLGMALGVLAILLAIWADRVFSSSSIFSWSHGEERAFALVLVVLGLGVFLAAYELTFRPPRR